MDITAFSSAATLALATSIAFLLVARGWTALSRTLGSRPHFADSILRESAQHYREDLDRLTAAQSIYLGGALVFAMLFTAAYVLEAGVIFAGYPNWQIYLQLAFLGAAAVFAAYKITTTVLARRQTRFLRDATIAIGHQLGQMSSGVIHVYHDVPTSSGTVDHVVVCNLGVYAVNVVARRAAPGETVNLKTNRLHFSASDESVSVGNLLARNARLGKHLRQVTGRPMRVRSVVAVPGFDIAEQSDECHLLVNERTSSMLLGWKDTTSFLMDDDVSAIRQALQNTDGKQRRAA